MWNPTRRKNVALFTMQKRILLQRKVVLWFNEPNDIYVPLWILYSPMIFDFLIMPGVKSLIGIITNWHAMKQTHCQTREASPDLSILAILVTWVRWVLLLITVSFHFILTYSHHSLTQRLFNAWVILQSSPLFFSLINISMISTWPIRWAIVVNWPMLMENWWRCCGLVANYHGHPRHFTPKFNNWPLSSHHISNMILRLIVLFVGLLQWFVSQT